MYREFTYQNVLASAERAGWRLDDVFGPDDRLDFAARFMPEALARTDIAPGLDPHERLLLNQISGHQYLSLFGVIEEFILPFVLDHARPLLNTDDYRVRALLQFAGEEAKHIQLFRRFQQAFAAGFGTPCQVIGPAEAIAAEVLRHDPLAVAMAILHIEWMTQGHYLDSVRDDGAIDPLFKSLLRRHWMEEAQHAKIDTLMVLALADARGEPAILAATDEYLEIGAFIDAALAQQAEFNVAALEQAIGHPVADRAALIAQQHQAARWTYLGSGMVHDQFVDTLATISPGARARVAAAAPQFG
ncbi:diiron oxygenase [Sphingomonas sp. SUN019]|uniref:diiron oxygenase n=1 Tax=Sphingomonas sp. SUN019 TaxID=2937788 RepID=UPI0021646D09|nr:diiron oxygenase [Sphingomonas sp. SUN019]UVO49686.1 diiron oxygenase [Sphingomonas sp. SUN019]